MKYIVLFTAVHLCVQSMLCAQDAQHLIIPTVKVVEAGEPVQDFRQYRRMLVGPDLNQPDNYPGYGGFVGWQSPIVLIQL